MSSIPQSLLDCLPDEIKALPKEKQLEWLSELLSHHHRHHRDEEQQQRAYEEVCRIISAEYKALHPHLYQIDGWKVAESFSEAVKSKDPVQMRAILTEEHPGVYTCDMLAKQTCQELVEEVHYFEKWCKDRQLRVNRPNSMNKYGAILDDFGFVQVLDVLMREYIQPFSEFLYPVLGQDLDRHHGFVVEYELGKDTRLGFHVDDSEVTLNLCLGEEFTGGQLFFKGVRCDKHIHTPPVENESFELQHKIGKGVFHVGRHRHGAQDLTSGYRINLIVWCRSSRQRQARSCGTCSCCTPCPEWCGLHSSTHHYT